MTYQSVCHSLGLPGSCSLDSFICCSGYTFLPGYLPMWTLCAIRWYIRRETRYLDTLYPNQSVFLQQPTPVHQRFKHQHTLYHTVCLCGNNICFTSWLYSVVEEVFEVIPNERVHIECPSTTCYCHYSKNGLGCGVGWGVGGSPTLQ